MSVRQWMACALLLLGSFRSGPLCAQARRIPLDEALTQARELNLELRAAGS